MLTYGTILMYSLFLIDELDIIPYINVWLIRKCEQIQARG